jgi:energy-coupling factor transporter ATP-binding protein EcfA2
MIEIRDLTKVYQTPGGLEVRALNKVNLTVEKGEFLAIMGASGSGKSTLLHMIGCVDTPTSGTVEIDHENIHTMNMFDLLHNIWCAFIPGILAGAISYQLIYRIYRSEYLIRWRFPVLGLLLGIVILFFSVGTTELILQTRKKKLSLSEQLRTED